MQTNIQNYKILAPVKNPEQRLDLANQISQTQLGAQTVFGIPLQQSLEAIPAIYAQLRENVNQNITDPTERAKIATDQLRESMSKFVLAQRESGAAGSDLIQVYAKLASVSQDAGLTQDWLLSISAAAAVKLNKSPQETATSVSSIVERAYGAGQAPLDKLGIATREVTSDGIIKFRNFNDILKDSVNLLDTVPSKAQELDIALGGQRRAPEAKAILDSYKQAEQIHASLQPVGTITDVRGQAVSGEYTGQEYNILLEKRRQTFQSALNEMQSSIGLFLDQVLVGGGVLDDFSKIIENVGSALHSVADEAKQHPEIFDRIKQAVYALVTILATVTVRGINLFAGIAGQINNLSTSVRGLFSGLSVGFRELIGNAEGSESVLVKVFDAMQNSGNSALQSMALGAKELQTSLYGVATAVEAATRETQGLEIVNAALRGATEKAPAPGVSSFWGTKAGQTIRNAGEAAGALALPVIFDFAANGFSAESLTNVGAGIAGGFAGAMIGGPAGALVGYTIADNVAKGLDLYGLFGTSAKEQQTFSSAYAKQITTTGPVSDDVVKQLSDFYNSHKLLVGIGSQNVTDYEKLIANQQNPSSFGELATSIQLKTTGSDREAAIYQKLKDTGTLDLFKASNVTNLGEFVDLLNSSKDKNTDIGRILDEHVQSEKAMKAAQDETNASADKAKTLYGTIADTIAKAKQELSSLKEYQSTIFSTPFGLSQFGAFGSLQQNLRNKFTPQFGSIANTPIFPITKEGNEQEAALKQVGDQTIQSFQTQSALIGALPELLGATIPVAQQLGLNYDDIQNKLVRIGTDGQNAFKQQIQGIIEAINFTQEYEATQQALLEIQARPEYLNAANEGHDQALAEAATYKQQLDTRKLMYDQYKQYIDLVRTEPDLLNKTLGSLEQQHQAQRRLISAGSPGTPGTPATFTPPSIVNVQDYTVQALQKAIEAAQTKQAQLIAINPGYAKQFADSQFLINNGNQFRGVSGIDQSFFNESLQAQKAALPAPNTEDLSQYSDAQVQRILQQARAMQDQAVKLAPDLADKYESERILVLRKNNQLLLESGLSQEYLKQAIQDNTASQNQLRGHYNVPGGYRVPTVFDYYANGGKETGDINFPSKSAGVSLDLATKIAQAINQAGTLAGKAGPDLAQIKDTNVTSGKDLTFYKGGSPGKPGTQPKYEDVPEIPPLPDIQLPPTPDQKKRLDQMIENFITLKQKQIDKLDADLVVEPGTTTTEKLVDQFTKLKQRQLDALDAPDLKRSGTSSGKPTSTALTGPGFQGTGSPTYDFQGTSDAVNKLKDNAGGAAQKTGDLGSAAATAASNTDGLGTTILRMGSEAGTAAGGLITGIGAAKSSISDFALDFVNVSLALNNFVRSLNVDNLFKTAQVTVNVNGVQTDATVTAKTVDTRAVTAGGQSLVANRNRNRPLGV